MAVSRKRGIRGRPSQSVMADLANAEVADFYELKGRKAFVAHLEALDRLI